MLRHAPPVCYPLRGVHVPSSLLLQTGRDCLGICGIDLSLDQGRPRPERPMTERACFVYRDRTMRRAPNMNTTTITPIDRSTAVLGRQITKVRAINLNTQMATFPLELGISSRTEIYLRDVPICRVVPSLSLKMDVHVILVHRELICAPGCEIEHNLIGELPSFSFKQTHADDPRHEYECTHSGMLCVPMTPRAQERSGVVLRQVREQTNQ